ITLALACSKRAELLSEMGQPAAALADAERAERLRAALAEEAPDDTSTRHEWAQAVHVLARLQGEAGRLGQARRNYQQAEVAYRDLATRHPGVPAYRAGLAATCTNRANLERDTRRTDTALRGYQEARRLLGQLTRE